MGIIPKFAVHSFIFASLFMWQREHTSIILLFSHSCDIWLPISRHAAHLIETSTLFLRYVDGLEPLKELDVVLQLLHRRFQPKPVGLLGLGVYDEWEALVLVVQLIPRLLQTLHGESRQHNQPGNVTVRTMIPLNRFTLSVAARSSSLRCFIALFSRCSFTKSSRFSWALISSLWSRRRYWGTSP